MSKINGIYAASMSIFNDDLSLNVAKTIQHSEQLIDEGCHGVAIFGSTGQAQLISISAKIELLNKLSSSKYKEKFIIGTGLNSLTETINLMKVSTSLSFKRFLIMPPAYYKYGHADVINFYSKIIEAVSDCEIVLYNFEKLCGYKFDIPTIKELVKKFPKQIIGIKDSTYNIFEELRLDNFSVLPGSETKLIKGLKVGCSGIITATCNITAKLSRKVYDDFIRDKSETDNKKLCDVRKAFENYNLISGIHAYYSTRDIIYKNVLPPLSLLCKKDYQDLEKNLISLNFKN
ncbi:dihydrodipicolinate synthase family protein [Candidatus Pelagibacter sp. HIMB1321]|uniref:dihydrodipicolinate synthase family protein n=1 Tax=Candidatus Pelagibacter sp. HIMB1321 TaxID=1388755 RepID=UPI000A07DD38|nr:dihydrodipicolinate synthase family protein [Candidatus Pelagibacter sp. HIMB1321]SMF81824.1 4-hydroxy-tetrahydrodipicolinate synthase [Candidatus Pelagibacter sp. HIMB1321]